MNDIERSRAIIEDLYARGIDLRGYEEFLVTVPDGDAAAALGIPIKNGELWQRQAASWFLATNQIRSIRINEHTDSIDMHPINGYVVPLRTFRRQEIEMEVLHPNDIDLGASEFMLGVADIVIKGEWFVKETETIIEPGNLAITKIAFVVIGKPSSIPM